jgi:hypothetical protein
VNLNTGALHVATYAYSPVTDKLLYFFTTAANNGTNSSAGSRVRGSAPATISTSRRGLYC